MEEYGSAYLDESVHVYGNSLIVQEVHGTLWRVMRSGRTDLRDSITLWHALCMEDVYGAIEDTTWPAPWPEYPRTWSMFKLQRGAGIIFLEWRRLGYPSANDLLGDDLPSFEIFARYVEESLRDTVLSEDLTSQVIAYRDLTPPAVW